MVGMIVFPAERRCAAWWCAQATVCAKFGLPCIIYMGAKDMERQALNVFRMRLLGAEVRRAAHAAHVCAHTPWLPSSRVLCERRVFSNDRACLVGFQYPPASAEQSSSNCERSFPTQPVSLVCACTGR